MPNLDLWPILETLKIRTKGAQIVQLRRDDPFAWAQRALVAEVERQYNAGLPVRIIILKGRQLGMSTLTEAILFIWGFIHANNFSLVLSREKDDSAYLLDMTKRYWYEGPFFDLFTTKYDSKNELVFDAPISSTIRVATATKDEVGRGMTIQACHYSEVAFWGDTADTIIPGLENAIPNEHGTIWIHESTARGVGGYFHDEWMAATDPSGGKSDFTAMFFPWFLHGEYEIEKHTLSYRDLDDDEHDVAAFLIKNDVEPTHILAKMAWRRRKIQNHPKGLDGFHEEYPCTPDEAFLSTGSNVFPLGDLAKCYDPHCGHDRGFLFNDNGKLAFANNDDGHTWVYKQPDRAGRQKYVVAVDPTKTIEGDPACIQVLNRATLEQVAVWHGASDPQKIGEIALALAYWYNGALLNTEIQGGGMGVLDVWRQAHYTNIYAYERPDKLRRSNAVLGWNTTYESKNRLLGNLVAAIKRKDILIHHPTTYVEMTQYVHLGDGTFGPARRSGHDDTVMALGIALTTCLAEIQNLDMPAIMGLTGNRGDQGPSASRLVMANTGRSVDPTAHIRPDYGLPTYAEPGEIDEWM